MARVRDVLVRFLGCCRPVFASTLHATCRKCMWHALNTVDAVQNGPTTRKHAGKPAPVLVSHPSSVWVCVCVRLCVFQRRCGEARAAVYTAVNTTVDIRRSHGSTERRDCRRPPSSPPALMPSRLLAAVVAAAVTALAASTAATDSSLHSGQSLFPPCAVLGPLVQKQRLQESRTRLVLSVFCRPCVLCFVVCLSLLFV